MSDPILLERDGAIAWLILNNEDKRNALTLAAWERLIERIAEVDTEDDLRCVVVRGAGEAAFAAGADISEFPDVRADAEQAAVYGEVVGRALAAIVECRHPTLAMIHGACTGGGLEIACACDIRISGESARFGVPINRIGHAFAYPEMVPVLAVAGRALVLELLLEGRIMEAAEAERRGLVNRVVADTGLEAETRAVVERIAAGAPLAARDTKRFANRLLVGEPLSADELADGYALCDSDDYAEGVRAFLAKQTPAFKGS